MGWRKSVIGIGGIAMAIVRTIGLTIDPMPTTVPNYYRPYYPYYYQPYYYRPGLSFWFGF